MKRYVVECKTDDWTQVGEEDSVEAANTVANFYRLGAANAGDVRTREVEVEIESADRRKEERPRKTT